MRGYLRLLLFLFALSMALSVPVRPASAHANLSQSDPPANSVLAAPPDEIRLWFTEPLEPEFSRMIVYDQQGDPVPGITSMVDPADPKQMYAAISGMAEGAYTIEWRVVSTADGHPTQGSFSLMIGAATAAGSALPEAESETVPAPDTLIRWFNLFSMSLAMGGLGFYLFVWQPAHLPLNPQATQRIHALVWIGWALLGVAGLGMLALQTANTAQVSVLEALTDPALQTTLTQTRFGDLWFIRSILWAGMGLVLLLLRSQALGYPVAGLLAGGILLTHSLFSHASAAPDRVPAISADWLHLAASSLWIGGLVAFLATVGPVKRQSQAAGLSHMVGYFSNFGRVAVASLIITGLYSAWLHVGSPEALLTTLYGQALLIKGLLILPLLGIAGINLLLTQRQLQAGNIAWFQALRGLLSAEIALTLAVLVTVGLMTSIAPARGVVALRAASSSLPAATPISETQTASNLFGGEGLTVQLDISPGSVGSNTFRLTITGEAGQPVEDVGRVHLRFTSPSGGVGSSELEDFAPVGEGVYENTGSNLSTSGAWQIRATIQREGEYDTLVDFSPEVAMPPAPAPQTLPDPMPAPLPRMIALTFTGLAAVGCAGFFLGRYRRSPLAHIYVLPLALLLIGVVFLANSTIELRALVSRQSTLAANMLPIRIVTTPGGSPPYLVTTAGQLLAPAETGLWQVLDLKADVKDALVSSTGHVWAAGDDGLYVLDNDTWHNIHSHAVQHLASTHGYLFSAGTAGALRLAEGRDLQFDSLRELALPAADVPAQAPVMLGTHTHALLNGDQVLHSDDLGLSWQPLNAPEPVLMLYTDTAGSLIAVTADQVLRREADTWAPFLPLPEGQPIDQMEIFKDQLYALAGGTLYRQANSSWQPVALPADAGPTFTAMAVQYPTTLWLLDASAAQLWSTRDGQAWTDLHIRVEG